MFLIWLPRYAGGVGMPDWTSCSFLSTSYGMETFHLLGNAKRGISSSCLPLLIVYPAVSRAVSSLLRTRSGHNNIRDSTNSDVFQS
jgi:hypothetical protein